MNHPSVRDMRRVTNAIVGAIVSAATIRASGALSDEDFDNVFRAARRVIRRVHGNRPDDHELTWPDLRLQLESALRHALGILEETE